MAKAGWEVTVLEKHDTPGGRARQLKASEFTFDMGPSWYWMPDVFERFFNCFGKKVEDYYQLVRLDPSYRIYWEESFLDLPANYDDIKKVFETIEPGAGAQLDRFMQEAAYKYKVGMHKLVHQPGHSFTEFLDIDLLKGIFNSDVFTSMKKHIAKHFKDTRLQQLMEFPVLFLGALAKDTPALYSLMNYADIKLGTWYPRGGMYTIVEGMYGLAKELGVKFLFNHDVVEIRTDQYLAKSVVAQTTNLSSIALAKEDLSTEALAKEDLSSGALAMEENQFILHSFSEGGQSTPNPIFEADVVIGAADYHFIETTLLPANCRTYSDEYWDKRVMAPACLLYYVGLNKKLNGILHHSLFFDTSFEVHGKEIYITPQWPTAPLFYVSATSVTDHTVAPEGCENLFFLVPVATGLQGDTEELRDEFFEKILSRFEKKTGQVIRDSIIYKKSYSLSNFVSDYNSFKGNAYGLANTLRQTAVLKPGLRSKKIKNLFYTGQLTVPGPGVPPSLISGEIVAKEVVKYYGTTKQKK